jgi:quercetin dioxygenase-like cupin family protein
MTEPVLVPPGEGEVIGDAPERRVEILTDDDALNATWSRFGPRRDGADLHVHRLHTDLFYVLQGELTVRLGLEDEASVVPAGTLARVPPLVVHGFRNGTDAELRYLNFHAPGRRFADYLRAMRDGRSFSYDQHPPPGDGERSPADASIGGTGVVAQRPDLRLELLVDDEDIGIAETRCAPGAAAAALQLHRHLECLYVLTGALTLTTHDGERRASAGTWVELLPGVAHALACAGEDETRFLEIHAPDSGYGAFVRALASGANDAQARAMFDIELV